MAPEYNHCPKSNPTSKPRQAVFSLLNPSQQLH